MYNERPISAECLDICGKIFREALTNQRTSTEQCETEDKPTVFVHFWAHIAQMEIIIYPNGYKNGAEHETIECELCADYYTLHDKIYKDLVAAYDRVRKVYADWEAKHNEH